MDFSLIEVVARRNGCPLFLTLSRKHY
jgi:hypothetical protein